MTERVNVDIPLKQKEIRALLEGQTSPVYKFLGRKKGIQLQYEVTDDGSHGDLVRYTKKLIRSLPYGKVLVMRVLFEGQRWDGDKH